MFETEEQKENYFKAEQFKREVERWVEREFNCINVSVYERIAQNPDPNTSDYSSYLEEHIRRESIDNLIEDYLIDIDEEKRRELVADWELTTQRVKPTHEEFVEFLALFKEEEIREYYQDHENYPIWSYLFEFKCEPPEEWLEYAQEVGLGVIDPFDEFHSTLFMTSCGHSFYSAYWIPLYLKCFPSEKEKWANIDFSMV